MRLGRWSLQARYKAGTHIKRPLAEGSFHHHGIYISDNLVIDANKTEDGSVLTCRVGSLSSVLASGLSASGYISYQASLFHGMAKQAQASAAYNDKIQSITQELLAVFNDVEQEEMECGRLARFIFNDIDKCPLDCPEVDLDDRLKHGLTTLNNISTLLAPHLKGNAKQLIWNRNWTLLFGVLSASTLGVGASHSASELHHVAQSGVKPKVLTGEQASLIDGMAKLAKASAADNVKIQSITNQLLDVLEEDKPHLWVAALRAAVFEEVAKCGTSSDQSDQFVAGLRVLNSISTRLVPELKGNAEQLAWNQMHTLLSDEMRASTLGGPSLSAIELHRVAQSGVKPQESVARTGFVRGTSYQDFCQVDGKSKESEVTVVSEPSSDVAGSQIAMRARRCIGLKFDYCPLSRNCEHWAELVVAGDPGIDRSAQQNQAKDVTIFGTALSGATVGTAAGMYMVPAATVCGFEFLGSMAVSCGLMSAPAIFPFVFFGGVVGYCSGVGTAVAITLPPGTIRDFFPDIPLKKRGRYTGRDGDRTSLG